MFSTVLLLLPKISPPQISLPLSLVLLTTPITSPPRPTAGRLASTPRPLPPPQLRRAQPHSIASCLASVPLPPPPPHLRRAPASLRPRQPRLRARPPPPHHGRIRHPTPGLLCRTLAAPVRPVCTTSLRLGLPSPGCSYRSAPRPPHARPPPRSRSPCCPKLKAERVGAVVEGEAGELSVYCCYRVFLLQQVI